MCSPVVSRVAARFRQTAAIGSITSRRLQNVSKTTADSSELERDWRELSWQPRALSLNQLVTKVARHQFVIKVVRTNPPFGTMYGLVLRGRPEGTCALYLIELQRPCQR
jgi:hypothetical protein